MYQCTKCGMKFEDWNKLSNFYHNCNNQWELVLEEAPDYETQEDLSIKVSEEVQTDERLS